MAQLGVELRRKRLLYWTDLLRELVGRDIKLRYKRSVLGIAWSLLSPLAQLVVLSFIFRIVVSVNVPEYRSFLFCGLLSWVWFQSSVLLSSGSITDNRALIRQPGFPVAILPVVTVTTHLIHYLLALPILLLLRVLDSSTFTAAILAMPLVIALQFALTLSIAYLAATFQVTFRDTQHLLGVLLLLLFYLTPIFYDTQAVPEAYRTLYQFNPLVHIIGAYRSILLQGTLPNLATFLGVCGLTAVMMWVGLTVFRRARDRFVEEL